MSLFASQKDILAANLTGRSEMHPERKLSSREMGRSPCFRDSLFHRFHEPLELF